MILGLSTSAFTELHVFLSLVAILSGIVVLLAMLGGRRLDGLSVLFLAATILTSVTGFLFPSTVLAPGRILGIISLVAVTLAVLALYVRHLAGPWRSIYVIAALVALYLNVFVGVVQAFQKLPSLAALAPTQSEPPFVIAQLVILVVFI